jgi:bifunctional ADP-heptose synthase (sugar kinase/adenylyltransferase)
MVLAGLEAVDYVVLFDEDTPKNLIDLVVPSVLVKGADYKPEDIVGFDTVTKNGGEVKTVTLIEGRSTTKTIERISNIG